MQLGFESAQTHAPWSLKQYTLLKRNYPENSQQTTATLVKGLGGRGGPDLKGSWFDRLDWHYQTKLQV